MATLLDAFKEIEKVNDNLGKINTALGGLQSSADTANLIEANTLAVEQGNAELSAINTGLLNGFAKVSEGRDVLIDQANFTNKAFTHHIQQTDTIICILEKVSRALCSIWTLVDIQTKLIRSIEDNSTTLREMYETVHADARLELDRRRALQRDIENCCPPRPDPPACKYEPCAAPQEFDEEIPTAEFEPLRLPQPVG
jgi:hypothetical protein